MTITRSDWKRVVVVVVWQLFNMVNLGGILFWWKGWKKEKEKGTSKGWLIVGSFQTAVTVLVLVDFAMLWLRVRRNEREREKEND